MSTERSEQLQGLAERRIPGGVNSPVRSYRSVHGIPRWIERGEGAYLVDVDGNRYLDFIGSWGALILGHAPAEVVQAIQRAAAAGTSFGASSPLELALVDAILKAMPAVEMLRLVNSGTEATMSAIRLARGFTGRDKVVKFEGCYHGHVDSLLVQAGSGVATLGLPSSAGVTTATTADTLAVPYNDLRAVEEVFARFPQEVACVIVEPIAGNMGCVPPEPGFLEGLRDLTQRYGAVLIFDEVITGFRAGPRGASGRYGVEPDMFTLGKIIGGGLPVGAYGGKARIMKNVAPLGPVYQAGTLSGNPLAMNAGLATLKCLAETPELYDQLEEHTTSLARGLESAARDAGVAATVQHVASMFTVFFGAGPIRNFSDAGRCDTQAFARFHAAMLKEGVMLPPSQFETAFVGRHHGEREIELALTSAQRALRTLSAQRGE